MIKNVSLFILLLLTVCQTNANNYKKLVPFVDPSVGTGAHNGDFSHGRDPLGQCMPAVLAPNGMNFWTAQTEASEAHGVCPYYADKNKIHGFRNSHYINGGSTQDYGSVTIMPLYGTLKCQPEQRASLFEHSQEECHPDYYRVPLFNGTIMAEMTGTSRTGIFRFTYKKAGTAYLVITPNSDEGEGQVRIDAAKGEITGCNPVHRIYQGKGEHAGFSGWFLVQINHKIDQYGVYAGDSVLNNQTAIAKTKRSGAYIGFKVNAGDEIIVKVASSFCDLQGAYRNMASENPAWDFDLTKHRLSQLWEKRLHAITVESPDTSALTKFYTALYHTSFLPHAFSDADGRYPSFAGGTKMEYTTGTYYADYSLWDTFRALHPLLNILYPKQSGEMIQSLIDKYKQGGWLPIFPAWNCYTSEMIGDHCASLIADAYIKGIRNFDVETAYQALIKNAFKTPDNYQDYKDGKGRRALTSYMKYGYIPLEDPVKDAYHVKEQVSRTLEYAYDDYCVARFAESLGKKEMAARLFKRALNYQNVFDPHTGYVQGRHADGTFVKAPSDKGQSFITEGNACQYSWFVPQDVKGLIKVMGGKQACILKLDSMFSQKRMWHGNEPSHHIGFMYNYVGEAWKTQRAVRHILETEYGTGANGLSGNDDAGQMSAWYIFASLGFYPVCPGSDYYVLSGPTFPRACIHLPNGKRFTIVAKNASKENIYIQSIRFNGKTYTKSYFLHQDLIKGGRMEIIMGNKPDKKWGSSESDVPPGSIHIATDNQ